MYTGIVFLTTMLTQKPMETEGGIFSSASGVAVRAGVKIRKMKMGEVNPYYLFFDCAATFLVSFCLFTITTVSRAISFGNDWIGMCAIGGGTAVSYVLLSYLTGGTTLPHFDIISVLLSLRVFGLRSFRKLNIDHIPHDNQFTPSVTQKEKSGQHRFKMNLTTAFALIVTLFASAFASAGICRLVLDSAFDNAEIVIRDSDFNSGEAFFVELFGYFFLNFLALLLPLNGAHPLNTGILLGLGVLGFQAFGYNVSSACFSFVRWLSVNAVGGSSAWSSDSWLWPVAGVVAAVSIAIVTRIMRMAQDYGDNWSPKDYQRA